jgi:hypothetical protein
MWAAVFGYLSVCVIAGLASCPWLERCLNQLQCEDAGLRMNPKLLSFEALKRFGNAHQRLVFIRNIFQSADHHRRG